MNLEAKAIHPSTDARLILNPENLAATIKKIKSSGGVTNLFIFKCYQLFFPFQARKSIDMKTCSALSDRVIL